MKDKILDALKQARETKQRKFDQSIDLIVNLKDFDMKRDSLNIFVSLPHSIGEKQIAAFLTKKSDLVFTVTQPEFQKYKSKREIKSLVKSYDFFISSAKLMPQVASAFGRYLGPASKMPSPQLGVLPVEDEARLKELISKIQKVIRIKAKETSVKFKIGKSNMSDEEIGDNIVAVINEITEALPKKKENLKSILVKLTMGKAISLPIL